MRRVDTAGEATEVAAQGAEEALGEVGSAQPVSPAGWPAQVGQHAFAFPLQFLHLP